MPDLLKNYPLRPARKEIRLLTILPAVQKESPIKCSLQVASLDNPPKFEAISYVWGDESGKKEISINDHPFEVLTNVDRIIRRLRLQGKRRVVWIDSICINQDDVDDRNNQIPLMSILYARASSVVAIVSLDGFQGDIKQAISWVEVFVRGKWGRKGAHWWIQGLISNFSFKARCQLQSATIDVFETISEYTFAPYWMRMWTYQEFRLARIDPVCICGETEFKASKLHPFTDLWSKVTQIHQNWLVMYSKEKGGSKWQENGAKVTKQMNEFASKIEAKYERQGIHVHLEDAKFEGVDHVLFQILLTYQRACKDPRDKIYALYGLLPSLQAAYPPDYNKSLDQIMFETARFVVDAGQSLAMMEECFPRKDRFEDTSIPSWVPDFTSTVMASGMKKYSKYSRGAVHEELQWKEGDGPSPQLGHDGSILRMSARPIGSCKVIFRFASDMKTVLSQLMDVFVTASIGCLKTPYWNSRLFHILFSHDLNNRTVDVGSAFDFQAAILGTIVSMFHWYQNTTDAIPEEPNIRKYLRRYILDNLQQTVFFVSQADMDSVAIGNADVQDGDEVVIGVSGVKTPLVLRQDPNAHDDDQVYYKLVGRAVIEGLTQYDQPESLYFTHVRGLPFEEIFLC